MSSLGGVPEGYKQTVVGIIPEDWEVAAASEACNKIQDGTHFSPKTGGNDYFYITSKNIRTGYLDLSTAERIDKNQHKSIYKRCDVRKGDILLTKDGANTGNATLNNLEDEFSLLSSVAFLRLDEQSYDSQYFLQQIICSQGQKQIQDAMSGNAITRLTLEKINKLIFPLPPTKTEQTAIANALSDADAWIQSLTRLIAKKRQIKQGAMQTLLNPYENGCLKAGWVMKKLGDICDIKTGSKNTQDKISNGKYPFFVRSQSVEKINSYSFDGEAILTAGDGVGTGKVFHYINGKFDYHQRVYKISKFKECVDGYYLFLYFSNNFYNRIMQMTAKSSVDSIRMEMIANMTIPLSVKKNEQIRIATILSDMDNEITALETKLTKAQKIKQGMMQNLLTGRIRLI